MPAEASTRIDECIEKTVGWLRATQDAQGRWLGATRGLDTSFYAIALALIDEPADSQTVQDLCDYFESCQTAEGGLGDYPGEPANGFQTTFILPILEWARPHSATISGAKEYLRRTYQNYNDPRIALSKWACLAENRTSIVEDKGPPNFIRKLGLLISKRHSSIRVKAQKEFPGHYRKQGLVERLLLPLLIRSMTYPPLDSLDEAARYAPSPTGFDIMVLVHAALRRLANDTTTGALRLYEFAKARRERFIYSDANYEWITVLTADLLFTKAFGMTEEFSKARAAVKSLKYQGKGWLTGDMATIHVFDSALLAAGLLEISLPIDDSMMRRALDYLKNARSPEDGMWAWAYTETMGARRPYTDTDDTGLICTLLMACGESKSDTLVTKAIEALLQMQDADGGFSLFNGVLRPNWCWVSNTSRSLQALVAYGLTTEDNPVRNAKHWLLAQQLPNGSWVDGWCTRYVYGTVIALEGLVKTAILPSDDPRIKGAVTWLLSQQNSDGGWGENWSGERSASICESTALAVYGLCIASKLDSQSKAAIEKGVEWLIDKQRSDGTWESTYNLNYGFGSGTSDNQLPNAWALSALGRAKRIFLDQPKTSLSLERA